MHTVLHAGSETAQTKGGDSGGRKTRVAVAGATGYTGQELVRLLARHPSVTVTAAMSSGAAGAATRRLPALAHIWDGDIVPFMADGLAPLLFSARASVLVGDLPAEESLEFLSGLLIGDELRAGLAAGQTPAALIGDAALCARYVAAFEQLGITGVSILSDAAPAHGTGTGGQGHADDCRQQLRRQADRERNGKQDGLDPRALEKQIHRQDEQDHGNRTAHKCEGRRGSQSLRNCRWDHENSGTNCRADDIGGESWNSNAANQLMIYSLFLLYPSGRFICHWRIVSHPVVQSKRRT